MSTEDATHRERASVLLLADNERGQENGLSCVSRSCCREGGSVKQRMVACGEERTVLY